ncbi:MAG: MCE family protein [Pseudonocardiaceae bacterium]|nr:MCE family protein [Pseudonocardiaceae bacterium]
MRGLLPPLIKIAVFTVVTVLLTGVLGFTIANTNTSDTSDYRARFTDVTALNEGDDVRMSGVRIGRVTSIETVRDTYADVGFEIEASRRLPSDVTARIKYRNLVGQKYVALSTGQSQTPSVLRPGELIPLERTQPALNLNALFNGFKPLFQALNPDDVNKLSAELVQVLQGEGSTVHSLLGHIGSLTSTLAGKDKVIGEVIDNLNHVLDTVHGRRAELAGLIDQLQQLSTGLAEQRRPIGQAVSSLGELTNTTADLLKSARPPLKQDIAELGSVAKNLGDHRQLVEKFVSGLAPKVRKITRTVNYGGWFNYYLCGLSGRVGISDLGITVDLPMLPLPGTQRPERCGP